MEKPRKTDKMQARQARAEASLCQENTKTQIVPQVSSKAVTDRLPERAEALGAVRNQLRGPMPGPGEILTSAWAAALHHRAQKITNQHRRGEQASAMLQAILATLSNALIASLLD